MELKNVCRGRMKEYSDEYKTAVYTPVDPKMDYNPLWNHKAHYAFPSATQNEINGEDAENLTKNGVYVVSDGANMPKEGSFINYVNGANIAGFAKVADSMIVQGVV
jgi:glutamate dehydrogenase (NADP+)